MIIRKVLILIYLLLSASVMFGQVKKGDMSLSISVSPFPTTQGENDDFGIIGLVGFEFFVSNKVSVLGSFYSSNNTIIRNDSGTTIRSNGFIPSIQYYFSNKEKYNVFGSIGYGFGYEDRTREEIQNSALTIFNIGLGAQYKISEKLFLKLSIPYFSATNITVDEIAADGIAIFIGLDFKL